MEKKDYYKKLAELAKNLTLLYVEDNLGLQREASKMFKKFFTNVITASDGQEGLEVFKKYSPDIVITDIKMPNLDGLAMAKEIKILDKKVQIIIASAFDEKEYLLESINIGIFKYLKKPIPINLLINSLIEAINKINDEKNIKLFDRYTADSFEYQNNILILIENNEVLTVNKKCLEFFSQENSITFKEFFQNFSKILLSQENFLYDTGKSNWLESIKEKANKLFNVKIKDKHGKNRHFVIKANKIPDKNDYYILSFDDITELGLLKEENSNSYNEKNTEEEKIKMINLLHVLKRNNSKIRIYNSYKGLSISNAGTIEEVTTEQIKIKTTYLQQRAIHINKKTIIESELFTQALECKLVSINFETRIVVLENFSFIPYLPSEQKYVRVMPESTSKAEIFFDKTKISVNININDISIEGCNFSFKSLPAGLKEKSDLLLKLKLGTEKSPLNLSIKSEVLKVKENTDKFEVVVNFKLEQEIKKQLVNYIARRQMSLIREFKGLQNAK